MGSVNEGMISPLTASNHQIANQKTQKQEDRTASTAGEEKKKKEAKCLTGGGENKNKHSRGETLKYRK